MWCLLRNRCVRAIPFHRGAAVLCRHVRSIVSLALDALAARDLRHVKANGYNQRVIRAMRLRYGLDDDRPRTLKEVGALLPVNAHPSHPACVESLCDQGRLAPSGSGIPPQSFPVPRDDSI